MNKAFFLDRDGVINVECDYLHDPDQVVLIPGTAEALKMIRSAGYLAVVVTNQSGIARGMYSEADTHAVHRRINELLQAEGTQIDAFYLCPHHPKHSGECSCRKPAPGMLLAAARDLQIQLEDSFMAGDRISDLDAGRNAGCRASYLVRTGYGSNLVEEARAAGYPVAADLREAVIAALKVVR